MAQEIKHGGDTSKCERQPSRNVVIAQTHDQNDGHGHGQHDPEDFINNLGEFVAVPQPLVIASPLLRNPHKLAVTGYLVSVYLHRQAQAAVAQVHAFLFPDESMIGARGALLRLALHKLEVVQVALDDPGQERFGDAARRSLIQVSARRGFLDLVIEADHLALGGHRDSKFLLLLRLKPSMLPAPQPDGSAGQPIHAVQALRPLQI